jgi:sugar phosphate isomerase/epimerase
VVSQKREQLLEVTRLVQQHPVTRRAASRRGVPFVGGEGRAAADQAGVALAAISGSFNAAHPDPAHRETYLDRFPHLCAAARNLQIEIITLSSGSRDPAPWSSTGSPRPASLSP